jgi:nitrogen fixation NifU-like protein
VEHYENPRNVGSLPKDEKAVGTGLVGAPACGDVMKLQIKVGADGRIEDAKFKTFGCGSAIASSSVATEWVKGRTVEECLAIKNTGAWGLQKGRRGKPSHPISPPPPPPSFLADIAAHLKLPPVKLHCSMLAEDAIKAAIKDWQSKRDAKA